jgi:hypothetical protein
MPRVAGAGVTWVTLSLSVIRYQHGNEEGPFSLRIHSLRST